MVGWYILYIFSRFGTLHQEKSGNPAQLQTAAKKINPSRV
jgi:hypothetical protein